MLGNSIQLAGCLLPFVLLFNLDKFFKSDEYITIMNRIFDMIASTSSQNRELATERLERRKIRLTEYEAAWYGAWSAGYITIGYILATLELDWHINKLLYRLSIFSFITLVLVLIASKVCSYATKKYFDKIIEQ